MTRPDAVVFDIGNVLLGWNPEAFYDGLIGAARRKALFSAVDLDGMNARIDRGAPFVPTVQAMRDAHPEWAAEIQIWQDRWIDMLSPVIDDSVTALHALKQEGVPVFALSNFGVQTFDWARTRFEVLGAFDMAFISGHLQLMKPEPEIYAALEQGTGMAGAQLFFIDDKPENIAAARARGWQGHVFSDPAALRADLARLDLLP